MNISSGLTYDKKTTILLPDGFKRYTAIEPFDLIEFQQKARETCCPKKLFELWEDVCQRYEHHEITRYELEEMKAIIWPNLQTLSLLKRLINDPIPEQPKQRKRKLER